MIQQLLEAVHRAMMMMILVVVLVLVVQVTEYLNSKYIHGIRVFEPAKNSHLQAISLLNRQSNHNNNNYVVDDDVEPCSNETRPHQTLDTFTTELHQPSTFTGASQRRCDSHI